MSELSCRMQKSTARARPVLNAFILSVASIPYADSVLPLRHLGAKDCGLQEKARLRGPLGTLTSQGNVEIQGEMNG